MSTKAELKENVLANHVETVLRWVLMNRGPVLTGIGVLIAAILLGSVFMIRRRENRDVQSTQIAMAESFLGQRQFDRAAQVLQDIRTKATDPSIIVRTAYFQGVTALEQKNYEQAAGFFREAADRAQGTPMKPLALANLGFALEEKKDFDAAVMTYGQFMSEFGDHFLAPRVQLAIGRSFLLSGKEEEGKKALNQLIDLYPTSPWAQNARSIMDKNKSR